MALIAEGRAPERILREISNREQRIRSLELEGERLQAVTPTAADIVRTRGRIAASCGKRCMGTQRVSVPPCGKSSKGPSRSQVGGYRLSVGGKTT